MKDSLDHPTRSSTELHGRWLLIARAGWAVVTVTILILYFVAMPGTYAAQFTPDMLQDLHRLNFSPTLYGLLYQGESAIQMFVYLSVGLLIFWRRSSDRMALFCAFTLVTFSAATAGNMYDFSSGAIAPALASNVILRVLFLVLFAVGNASPVLFFYLFPSGRFVPRWTRWSALFVAAFWLGVIFFPDLPVGPATYLIPFFQLTAVVSQVIRYRRFSTPIERQQTKWAVFGFVLTMAIIVAMIAAGPLVPPALAASPALSNLGSTSIFTLAFLFIPIFMAIAISRSRLWAIDAIINKTLVYAALTATLALFYFGSVLALQQVFRSLTGDVSPIAIVISTLTIAALFAPLRKRMQYFIDRRFYRQKYSASLTLENFSAAARNEVELGKLTDQLLKVAGEAIQPQSISLWLQPSAGNKPQGRERIRKA